MATHSNLTERHMDDATRWRVIPFWLAVTVAVLGGLGPFLGTAGFVYESHRRAQGSPATNR